MKRKTALLFSIVIILIAGISFTFTAPRSEDDLFISYQLNPKKQDLKLYWKNGNGRPFKSIQNLKDWLATKNKTLVFAMNAGMYKEDNSPLGLFIQDNKTVSPLNTTNANGNFYMKPNGVLYITTDNIAVICKTENFKSNKKIKYATQSGPMLVIDGSLHPSFKQGSVNVNIRNGVGILPNNELIFAMSKKEINLYDFAMYFKKLGCRNALYLDGFVSRTYLPEKKWIQLDGNFGVIVGVTTNTL